MQSLSSEQTNILMENNKTIFDLHSFADFFHGYAGTLHWN
jgi:hypothetical protein